MQACPSSLKPEYDTIPMVLTVSQVRGLQTVTMCLIRVGREHTDYFSKRDCSIKRYGSRDGGFARQLANIYSTRKGTHFHVQMNPDANSTSGSIVGHRVPELYQRATGTVTSSWLVGNAVLEYTNCTRIPQLARCASRLRSPLKESFDRRQASKEITRETVKVATGMHAMI